MINQTTFISFSDIQLVFSYSLLCLFLHPCHKILFPMPSWVLTHIVISLQAPGPVSLAKRREDEVSIGSTPLAKQTSNQASDYASSPVKTKTVTGKLTTPCCVIVCFDIEDITQIIQLIRCTSYDNMTESMQCNVFSTQQKHFQEPRNGWLCI